MSNRIITISREYGSGGRDVGCLLAARLGVPFYDKHVAELSAEQSGLSADFIEKEEDRIPGKLSYRGGFLGATLPLPDRIFLAQCEAIRKLAAQGPCVIVGRCADYVLRGTPGCINIFLHAPLSKRIKRVSRRTAWTDSQAEEHIRVADKRRAAYYEYYTQATWGLAANYHFSLDASLGTKTTAEIIMRLLDVIEEVEG